MAAIDLNMERYEAGGAGAPLLIAHGLFGAARNFATLAKRLAAERPVAVVDMRNHGDSPWAPEMDYRTLGADLLAAAARAFDRPAILLGHSMGGKAAMAAALLAPEKLAGLIVADIAPVVYQRPEFVRSIDAMLAVDFTGVSKRSEVEPMLVEAAPDPALRAFLLQNVVFEGQGADAARRGRWRFNLIALRDQLEELVGWPQALRGAVYDGPAYFLHGGASDYVAADGRAAIAAAFPKAAIDTLEGAGHWLHAEKPEAFYQRVQAWLAGR